MARDAFSPVPVQVLGITDATAIAADGSCALHRTGTISCWGYGQDGQLGNGNEANSLIPVQVVGITDATAITAGWHSCALHRGGTISCWGANWYGQLGNGQSTGDVGDDSANSSVPVQVMGITDATAITAEGHSCALHQNGTISCWGYNGQGQLGDGQGGAYKFSAMPVQVVGITDATAIAAGDFHTCALHQDGTVSCWGANWYGQLGNGQSGRNADSLVPVQVFGITDATAITVGVGHSCALHRGGTISCWGDNEWGELGNQETPRNISGAGSSVPVQVTGITDATAISAGSSYSCALHQNGTISCWGVNVYGTLGNGRGGSREYSRAPVQVTGFGG